MPSLTIREAVAEAAKTLRRHGLASARLDAEVILAFVLQASRQDLYLKSEEPLPASTFRQYLALVARRRNREPVAYLTGEKEFLSLSFKVDRNVLIPRPETEILAEEAIAIKPRRIIDVGTGSGAIAVSLAYYLPESRVWATDISPQALPVARFNAARHRVSDRVSFHQGRLLEPVAAAESGSRFDLITANLPYIPSPEMDNLPLEVRNYEPVEALDGGADGLTWYRELAPGALELLRTGGALLLEAGPAQTVEMSAFLAGTGYRDIEVIKDLAGFDRVIKAFK